MAILYVLPEQQVNEKTLRFIDEAGLREDVTFLVDPGSAAIDLLGIRKPDPEPMEAGVPHPTTYLIDPDGTVRFVDVRVDFHEWLDSEYLAEIVANER